MSTSEIRRRTPAAAHMTALLAAIAVPALGWFIGGWTGATTLVVYWAETVLICLFAWGRIRVHQRWNPRRGHFRYQGPGATPGAQTGAFASGFALLAAAFTGAHAIFLAAMLLLLTKNGYTSIVAIDWRAVAIGCGLILTLLTIDFMVELTDLRQWSFRQVELAANQGISRVAVVHLTLIVGMAGIALTDAPETLFGVFVVLKTLASLSWLLPQWEPATAPVWLSRVMNRVPGKHPGERFEDFWAKDRESELQRRKRNEDPWTRAATD